MPQISIIVPVHNQEKYLNQCLDSLLSQTFEDWECIVWDDGSIDRSKELAIVYEKLDERFFVIRTTHNMGIAQSLHSAIKSTVGNLVGILDSDDWLEPTCLEKAIQPFLDGWEMGLVYTDYFKEESGIQTKVRNPEFYPDHLFFPGYCPHHFRLFKRSLYEQVGGVNLEFPVAVDYDLMLRMGEAAGFVHIPEPLYHYRIHPNQVSQTRKDEQLMWASRAAQQAIVRRGLQERYSANLSWSVRVKEYMRG